MPSKPQRRLQVFVNPKPGREYTIRFECPEFTCLCPRTGQPDFATFRIAYVPDKTCIGLSSQTSSIALTSSSVVRLKLTPRRIRSLT